MRTVPYMFRCCGHCRHGGVQNGHTAPCHHWPCPGSRPKPSYLVWRLFHLRRRW
jgi:hypothetical protein